MEEVLKKVEERIAKVINTEGVKKENVDYLFKLVDIHKDIKNENYWKVKEEKLNEIRKRLWSKNER